MSYLQHTIGLSEVVQVSMKLADIQQGMGVIEWVFELRESGIGTLEEDKRKSVAFVLLGDMREAGVDTSAVKRIRYLRAVGSYIMNSSLGDIALIGEVATHVVVGYALGITIGSASRKE